VSAADSMSHVIIGTNVVLLISSLWLRLMFACRQKLFNLLSPALAFAKRGEMYVLICVSDLRYTPRYFANVLL
jgi:hypothetical protein